MGKQGPNSWLTQLNVSLLVQTVPKQPTKKWVPSKQLGQTITIHRLSLNNESMWSNHTKAVVQLSQTSNQLNRTILQQPVFRVKQRQNTEQTQQLTIRSDNARTMGQLNQMIATHPVCCKQPIGCLKQCPNVWINSLKHPVSSIKPNQLG